MSDDNLFEAPINLIDTGQATRLRVAAQGISVEAGGAAGAIGELQRCPAVVDQLQLLDEEFLQPLGVS